MKKTLLILFSALLVLVGCQDDAPSETIATAPVEATEQVTEGIQTIKLVADSSISSAESTQVRSENVEKPRLSHTARNTLDWEGVYKGVFPCADCSGIETSLTLSFDGSYAYDQAYLGKGEEEAVKTTGEFVWNSDGDTITLSGSNEAQQFLVGENMLMMLDSEGNIIQGEMAKKYTLVQQK